MNVVIYVCHVDDGILGCGGTIPQMVEAGHEVHVVYATEDYNYHPDKDRNDNRTEAVAGLGILGIPERNIHFLEFPTMRLDTTPIIDLNIAFEQLSLEPDIIISLSPIDVNQDHRAVYQSALVIGRSIDRQIGLATMEVLSSSEWGDTSFEPNFYVDVTKTIDMKVEAMSHIASEFESWPHPRSAEGIRTKARQRGMEVGLDYAEALRLVRWFDFDERLTV